MYSSKVISTAHRDLVHDVAFNFHGTQLATCSSDQTLKVWEWQKDEKTWTCQAEWKAHSGSVWKVTWAHPEFGKVLATCSFDRTAAIWEELPADPHSATPSLHSQQQQQGGQPAGVGVVRGPNSGLSAAPRFGETGMGPKCKTQWVKKATLVDSRTSVTDIKFSPKHHGLLLASCSADGQIRIYECSDIMNLTQWNLLHEITTKMSLSCVSWNPSSRRSQPPMIAVGSDDPNRANTAGRVQIYEYADDSRRWTCVESLTSVTEPVHDLAFAPNMGRSYNVLGVASSGDLRIITLKQLQAGEAPVDVANVGMNPASHSYEIKLAGQFNDHASTVWRVCWNITGTILASSGDDGMVRLWKCNYLDNWKCVATLRGDGGNRPQQPGTGFIPASVGLASHMGQQWPPQQQF